MQVKAVLIGLSRLTLHNIKLIGEAAKANEDAARLFVNTFKASLDTQGCSPDQIFNADESGLYWKRMPSRTFVS